MARIRYPLLTALALCLAYLIGFVADSCVAGRNQPYPTEEKEPKYLPLEDGCRICGHAHRHAIDVVPLTLRSIERCGAPCIPLLALHPAGSVRLRDLETFSFQVDVDYEAGGNLEFRVNGKLVASEPFQPTLDRTRGRIPVAVLDRLRDERGRLTWGYVPPKGEPELKHVRIINFSSRTDDRLKRLQHTTRDEPPYVRHVLEGLFFHRLGMNEAALREAKAALALKPQEPHAMALLSDVLLGLDMRMSIDWLDARQECYRLVKARASDRHKREERCRLERKRRPGERGPAGGC